MTDAARPSVFSALRDRDHTRGSLLASIGVLSVPSMVTGLLGGGLFALVELRFLGLLGPENVAAAGATNQTLRQFFFLILFGLGMASQMMIARLVGEGARDAADRVAGQSFAIAALISLIGAVIGGLFPAALAGLVVRDPDVLGPATIYVQIAFVTLFVQVFSQIFSSVLSGAGDTTTPLIVTLVTTPVSIAAQWVLAFGALGVPPLGIAGIALGAAVGGVVNAAISLWALFSGRARMHLSARHLLPDLALARRVLAVSWQPALHMLARTTVVFFFMWLAGRLGGKVQAAYTIGLRLEMVPMMLAFMVANSTSTLVGQNLGSGDLPRAKRAIWVGFAVELAMLWPIALALFLYRHELVGAFTQDPEVHALAVEYLVFSSAILGFYGLYFVAFRSLQASGDMNSPMRISVAVALGVGAPLGWYLATQSGYGATGMWIGNLIYAVVNAVLMVGWLLSGRWTRAHREGLGESLGG